MSWMYGQNSEGREIGYGVKATCDFDGCATQIDRGLAYVCGGMHDGGDYGCGKYFCGEHLRAVGLCGRCEGNAECPECGGCGVTPDHLDCPECDGTGARELTW